MLTLLIILSLLVSFGIIRKQRIRKEQRRFERNVKMIRKILENYSRSLKKRENKVKKKLKRSGR